MEDEVLCFDGVNSIVNQIHQANYSFEVFKASVELFLTVLSKIQIDKENYISEICTLILKFTKQHYEHTLHSFTWEVKVKM